MNIRAEQVAALSTSLKNALREGRGDRTWGRAIALARELVQCGEWRLCLDLVVAAGEVAPSGLERAECDLIRADALLGMGDASAAGEVLTALLASASDSQLTIEQLDWAKLHMSRVLYYRYRVEESWRIAAELRTSILRRGESAALGWSALVLGNLSWVRGAIREAKKYLMEAVISASRVGDLRLEAYSTQNLGLLKRHQCYWREANESLEMSRDLWVRLGNREQSGYALRSLAIIAWKWGRLEVARKTARESLLTAVEGGDQRGEAYSHQLLALIDLHEGDFASARERLNQSLSYTGGGEASRVLLLASEFLGDVELEQGNAEAALRHYDHVLPEALARVPRGDIVAELRRRRAECFHLLGRHGEAYAEAQTGLTHCRELGDRYEEASTCRVAAQAAAALNRHDEAKRLFDQGFALFEDIETPYEWGKLWQAFGEWLASEEAGPHRDVRLAAEAFHAACDRFESMGAKARLGEVEARIARLSEPVGDASAVRESARETAPAPRPRPARAKLAREVERRAEWARETFGVITANPGMFQLLERVEKLAQSRSPILVLGESGTGKELVAEALHRLSGRRGEYMAINCATLPREVIESELFGHVAGSFTGATRDKLGLLEVCDGGTVFLDEVGEMAPELQARLLRFLESGEIRRVGATRVSRLQTRVIAATNRERTELRAGQSFRSDLYYRLAHAVVQLPPLRRRGTRDIELLAFHFLEHACGEEGKRVQLSGAALERLTSYAWPGNVRELRSTIAEHVLVAHDGHEIQADELHLEAEGAPATLADELAQAERGRIQEALRQTAQSKSDAARLLGIPRTTLIGRMRRLGLE